MRGRGVEKETLKTDHPRLLDVSSLDAGYGSLQILWNVSIHVLKGELIALVGANGSGKTTTLRAIAGLLRPSRGRVYVSGDLVTGLKAHQLNRRGISFISEDLNLFLGMSVYENLSLGAYTNHDRKRIRTRLEYVFDLFPVLKDRSGQFAGTLSGGERRMLGIGRALMSEALLLLIDEPSVGLAPNFASQVFDALSSLNRSGVSILLAEQNVNRTLRMASRSYVMEHGRIVLQGPSNELLETDLVRKSYLGLE